MYLYRVYIPRLMKTNKNYIVYVFIIHFNILFIGVETEILFISIIQHIMLVIMFFGLLITVLQKQIFIKISKIIIKVK